MHKENVALCVIAGAFVDEFGIVSGLDNDILLALSRHYIQELQKSAKRYIFNEFTHRTSALTLSQVDKFLIIK